MKNTPTSSTTQAFGLKNRIADNLAKFSERLNQHRFWHLLPQGQNDLGKATGLLDTKTNRWYPSAASLRSFLDQNPFVFVQEVANNKTLATLHSTTRLLWNHETVFDAYFSPADGKEMAQEGRWAGLEGWQLPNKDMLQAFAMPDANPHRNGPKYHLLGTNMWLVSRGRCCVNEGAWGVDDGVGCIFACHLLWKKSSDADMLMEIATRGWKLVTPTGQMFQPNCDVSPIERLTAWVKNNRYARSGEQDKDILNPHDFWVASQLSDVDYTPCRLPKLDTAQLSDPEKGLWELWGEDESALKSSGFVARNPAVDLKNRAVAIDFGTSSTVVAMNTTSGNRELLRIGVRDFYQVPLPQHFENPTVLECLDFPAFQAAWTQCAYRPPLDWNTMRAAHEAQSSFRDNPGDTRVLASILPRIKQWALRSEDTRIRLSDRQGHELELAPHTERNPVRGQPMQINPEDPFDPVELYAWYLGMAINWRGRGLFLKYYLSFPVDYPREIKDRVLASFRRGLQRSLPPTLIEHHPQVLNEFEVVGLASEPAAYAAAALPHLELEPTEEGLPYAVFDFGGGTTDFDFGLLRWATVEEDAQGYERVFEYLANSGDNYLGGENLLEHLVYASFQENLPVLREHRIQFTLPLAASPFTGSESFIAKTQAAQTNTVMLSAKLRPFLESETHNLHGQIKIDLLDPNGLKKTCELVFDAQKLDALLANRMKEGVLAFLRELARQQSKLPAAPVHVLLAGNGCRSRHITALFDTQGELWQTLLAQAFGETTPPEIVVHPPLSIDEQNMHAPTAKTGVALGLLRLVPGEGTKLIDRVRDSHDGQAPFAWHVGRLRRGRFEPILQQGTAYQQWHELGPLQEGVFNLFTTTSPRAHNHMTEGDPELSKHRLDFPAVPAGSKLFARAVSPDTLELTCAQDKSALQHQESLQIRSFDLK